MWRRVELNRRNLDESRLRRWASPAIFGLHRALAPELRQHARGSWLDVGCGMMPYRSVVVGSVARFDGLDVERRSKDVRFLASVEDMAPVPSSSYDVVLCSEVLEHVERPEQAIREISRVLRPDGLVIVTVPFLSRLHEEPTDYYRYTEYGLRALLASSGFAEIVVKSYGSIGSFLGHQVSTVIVGTTWHLPIVKWFAFGFNLLVVVIPALVLDLVARPLRSKLPLGYICVARNCHEPPEGKDSHSR